MYHPVRRQENMGREFRGRKPASGSRLLESAASANKNLCSNILFRLDDFIRKARIPKGGGHDS